jgi:hypothetical protein
MSLAKCSMSRSQRMRGGLVCDEFIDVNKPFSYKTAKKAAITTTIKLRTISSEIRLFNLPTYNDTMNSSAS